ncbi:MAG: TRAP transporter substrate-binding protein DctP [Pseudomonadota bacterium]
MRWMGLLAAAICAPALAFANCDPGETKITFPHDAPATGHPKGEAAAFLAQMVNMELQGRLCMEVIADAPNYSDASVTEGLADGSFQMAAPAMGTMGELSPRFLIFDMPFLFKDLDVVLAYQESPAGLALLTEMADEGVRGLGYWTDGMKELSGPLPLRSPGDVAGLNVGIQPSVIEAHYIDTLQATPRPLDPRALQTALRDGVVNAQNSTFTTIASRRLHLNQAAVTVSNHGLVQYMLVVSEPFWQSLDPATQADLEFLVMLVGLERNRFAFEFSEQSKREIRSDGTPIVELSEEERYAWVRAMQPTWFAFGGDVGFDQIAAALYLERELAAGRLESFTGR